MGSSTSVEKKSRENTKEANKNVRQILAVNNNSLRPYVEIFEHHPENIVTQPLGSLVGFFEVREYSQDSAYIVNFLSSVLKKEYYANPKRSVTDSLDSALHKLNLALSEIAKHGNVRWLGVLDGAVCVLEKNSLHFGVTGKAKVLLLRGQTTTDISQDLASEEAAGNPLKTFIHVSSGRLEIDDKVLIVSTEILDLFPNDQLKKNALRMDNEKFVQFLRTALSNELELAAAVIIDIEKALTNNPSPRRTNKINPAKPLKVSEQVAPNAFSEQAFKHKSGAETIAEALAQNQELQNGASLGQKSAHIYVQQEEVLTRKHQLYQELLIWQEKMLDLQHNLSRAIRRTLRKSRRRIAARLTSSTTTTVATLLGDTLSTKISGASTPLQAPAPLKSHFANPESRAQQDTFTKQPAASFTDQAPAQQEQHPPISSSNSLDHQQPTAPFIQPSSLAKYGALLTNIAQKSALSAQHLLAIAQAKISNRRQQNSATEKIATQETKTTALPTYLLPHLYRLRETFGKLNYQSGWF